MLLDYSLPVEEKKCSKIAPRQKIREYYFEFGRAPRSCWACSRTNEGENFELPIQFIKKTIFLLKIFIGLLDTEIGLFLKLCLMSPIR